MDKPNLRAELRVPMTRRGALVAGSSSMACLIQDFSSNGFLIMCNKPLAVGQILELKCELYPERFLQCKVEIRHVNEGCLGTRIVEITEAARSLCKQFLDEHYSDRLGKFDH